MALAIALLPGCDRESIQVYRVAKESSAQTLPDRSSPAHPPTDRPGRAPSLTWKLPADWKEVPPGEMRLASFRIGDPSGKQADVSIIPLAGTGGGDLNNVNRWRSQVGQAAVTESELASLCQRVEMDGHVAQLYDLPGRDPASSHPARILGAILHQDHVAWFVKMTGPDDLVATQKPAFIEFLKSVTFPAGPAKGTHP